MRPTLYTDVTVAETIMPVEEVGGGIRTGMSAWTWIWGIDNLNGVCFGSAEVGGGSGSGVVLGGWPAYLAGSHRTLYTGARVDRIDRRARQIRSINRLGRRCPGTDTCCEAADLERDDEFRVVVNWGELHVVPNGKWVRCQGFFGA